MPITFSYRVVAAVAVAAIAVGAQALAGQAGAVVSRPGGAAVGRDVTSRAAPDAAFRYWTPARMTAALRAADGRQAARASAGAAARPRPAGRPAGPPPANRPRHLTRKAPSAPRAPWLTGDTTGRGLRWTHEGAVAAAVGKVFFTLGGTDYVCSGALVGGKHPDVVLTAAHCVSSGPGQPKTAAATPPGATPAPASTAGATPTPAGPGGATPIPASTPRATPTPTAPTPSRTPPASTARATPTPTTPTPSSTPPAGAGQASTTPASTTQWATNWMFAPDFSDGRLPYGEYTARQFFVSPDWTGPKGGREQYDVAFVRVGPATPDGSSGPAKPPPGLPVKFTASQDKAPPGRAYVFGYPSEQPYSGLYLNYCAGPVVASGGSVRVPCGMTAGDSGGPWLAPFSPGSGSGQVVAVSTYKVSSDLRELYGAVLGPQAHALYQRAVS